MFLAVFVFYGCDSDGDGTVAGPQDTIEAEIMSLKAGNMWIHEFRHLFGDTLIFEFPDSMIIDSTCLLRGNEWCVLREQLDQVASLNFYRQAEDGIRMLHILHEDTTEGLFFKYPVEQGDVWIAPNGEWLTCLSTTATVIVPFGTYENCIHFSYVNDDDDEGMWLKPGIGWIKSMWREGDHTFWFSLQELLVN
jgi:hypothetical protein